MISESEKIGDIIRIARKSKKITQAQLGRELGISKLTVSGYETGKVKVIPFEKRVKLSKILDIKMNELFYSNEQIESQPAYETVNKIFDGALRGTKDGEKALEISRAIYSKEINDYSHYFTNLSDKLSLNELIYIIVTVFLTVKYHLGFGMCLSVLKAVLETRFRLYGMDGVQAQKDANDICNILFFSFTDCYFQESQESRLNALNEVVIVESNEELQQKLKEALNYFGGVPGSIHRLAKHEIFPGAGGLPPMSTSEKEE